MITDHTGLAITAASQDAADAFDRTLVAYLRFGNDIGDLLKTTYSQDSEMVLANVLRGYFMHMMGMRVLVPKAQQSLEAAQRGAGDATPREQLHVKALAAWCELDLAGATTAWEDSIRENPHGCACRQDAALHPLLYGRSGQLARLGRPGVARLGRPQ